MPKWIAVFLALVIMFSITDPLYAERPLRIPNQVQSDAYKQKMIHRIFAIKNKIDRKQMNIRSSKATVATTVRYKGRINHAIQDEYVFKLATSRKVKITANHSSSKVDYLLAGTNGTGSIYFYQDGDTLPAGDYSFFVFADSASSIDYDYTIDGLTYASAPETTLPKINLTQPTQPVNRLPKDTAELVFSGTTDSNTELMSNETFRRQLSASFHVAVPMRQGNNYVDIQAVTNYGNATYLHFDPVVPTLKRMGGTDRYAVSTRVAQEMPPSDTIIIASGGSDKFADALSGGSLAGLSQAPILLTAPTELPQAIRSEITRRKPSHAIIMGGTDTIQPAVESQLKSLGVTHIERMDGANRFAVAVSAAKKLTATLGNETSDTAIIANGMIFSDALSSSSTTADALIPTLLVTNNQIPTETQAFIQAHPEIKKMIIVGGTGTVSKSIADQLTAAGKTVKRVDGANRYVVGVNLAKLMGMDMRHLVFAKGTDYPDALSGGPLAAVQTASISPLFLTPTQQLDTTVKTYLDQNQSQIQVIYLLGDKGSISQNVENALEQYVR